MEISITLNNKLICNKEINSKDILKPVGKIIFFTVGIVLTKNTLCYASTVPKHLFKGEVSQATIYIILRLLEVAEHNEICNSLEWYDYVVTDVLKGLGGVGIDMLKDSFSIFM